MFRYDPKDAAECLPAGDYDAELCTVTEGTSSKGNPMLTCTWTVVRDGREYTVFDYITNPGGIFKLKDIARAWQMVRDFEEVRFDLSEHIGKLIRVKLKLETSDKYRDKNVIASFMEAANEPPLRQPDAAPAGTPSLDQIPF